MSIASKMRPANYQPGPVQHLPRPASMASLSRPPLERASSSAGLRKLEDSRPASRASWKTFNDDSGCRDIAAAMAAANRAMKHKGMSNQANELQSSFAEADRRIAQEAEDLEAKREADQDKAARKLKASMKKGNSKALKRSIEDAANL